MAIKSSFLFLVVVAALNVSAFGQKNLLLNSNADNAASHWKVYGDATVEDLDGEHFFVVRNGGYFFQDVRLAADAEGKYALLIGKASAERINANGSITDLPYLYGYMMYDYKPFAGSRINTYLQGQRMLLRSRTKGEWSKVYGIFKVAPGTEAIRFFLNQARRRGDPHDGSEARFDNLGLYLFDLETDAASFAERY